jgi:hypothetical protein
VTGARRRNDDGDRFLAYDKDRRWFDAKAEGAPIDEIVHRRDETWFPLLSRRSVRFVTGCVHRRWPDDQHTA